MCHPKGVTGRGLCLQAFQALLVWAHCYCENGQYCDSRYPYTLCEYDETYRHVVQIRRILRTEHQVDFHFARYFTKFSGKRLGTIKDETSVQKILLLNMEAK